MAISERDIKILWGRAAARCSICKQKVTANKETVEGIYLFGENAHIFSEKPDGPRGDGGLPESMRNSYWNLILLCPSCHTKIDKAVEDYPTDKLHELKRMHEAEVDHLHPADKESYDKFLRFSRVTQENWLSPDRKDYVPFGVSQMEWIAPFLEPQLDATVPADVVRAYEVARGCMIYSWFFYPLATLGLEQLTRVAILAVRLRSRTLNCETSDFVATLEALVQSKAIQELEASRWKALGFLSHDQFNPAGVTIYDPGQAVQTLRSISELINALFTGEK